MYEPDVFHLLPLTTQLKAMKFIVEAFDKENEFPDFEVVLPDDCEAQLAEIMNGSSPQRGDEGYDLNETQLSNIEVLAGKRFNDEKHIFQLTCNVS